MNDQEVFDELCGYFAEFAKSRNLSDAAVNIALWGFECGFKAYAQANKESLHKLREDGPQSFREWIYFRSMMDE